MTEDVATAAMQGGIWLRLAKQGVTCNQTAGLFAAAARRLRKPDCMSGPIRLDASALILSGNSMRTQFREQVRMIRHYFGVWMRKQNELHGSGFIAGGN